MFSEIQVYSSFRDISSWEVMMSNSLQEVTLAVAKETSDITYVMPDV